MLGKIWRPGIAAQSQLSAQQLSGSVSVSRPTVGTLAFFSKSMHGVRLKRQVQTRHLLAAAVSSISLGWTLRITVSLTRRFECFIENS